jgi:hypothetical protein
MPPVERPFDFMGTRPPVGAYAHPLVPQVVTVYVRDLAKSITISAPDAARLLAAVWARPKFESAAERIDGATWLGGTGSDIEFKVVEDEAVLRHSQTFPISPVRLRG